MPVVQRYARGIIKALKKMHENKIVHTDIKVSQGCNSSAWKRFDFFQNFPKKIHV